MKSKLYRKRIVLCVSFIMTYAFKELPNGVRYLRWGGGTAKPSTEKKAEAKKTLEKRGDSPASSARCVRCGDPIRMIPLTILPRSSRGRARKRTGPFPKFGS